MLAFAILILSKVCITAGCTAGAILIMKEVEYFTEVPRARETQRPSTRTCVVCCARVL